MTIAKPALDHPLPGQSTAFVANLSSDSDRGQPEPVVRQLPVRVESANIMTSQVEGAPGTHKVVLDVDLPCVLIPSSTTGHY